MSEFKQQWDWAASRGQFQQDYDELEHVANLMNSCSPTHYLEVGSAEGNSLYILGSAVVNGGHIDVIDFGETHTDGLRKQAIEKLSTRRVTEFLGDSTNPSTFPKRIGLQQTKYDCVLIDGGHDFATVLSDSILYAPLATKYIFWHDIQLPQVKMAVDWFVSRWKLGKYSTFINSPTFGYGIMEVGKQ